MELKAYYDLEPLGELRQDWRIAMIVQMLHNVNVKKENQLAIDKFLLTFNAPKAEQKQSVADQLRILNIMAGAHSVPGIDQ